MEIHVLGPFGVFEDGLRLEIGTTKMHGLYVAALAMTTQLSAPQTYVAQRLWPEELPDNPGERLRQYRTELRRMAPRLIPDHSERLRCRLDVPPRAVDYLRFLSLARSARGESARKRSRALRVALNEWNGEPIADITAPGLEPDRKRLTSEWRDAWIGYLNALLEAGDTERLVQEIREPMSRWSSDEQLLRIKLDALHATTGKNEIETAVAEWRAAGGVMSNSLEAHVMALDMTLGKPPRHAPSATPQLLPAHRPAIVGRTEQKAELDRSLLGPPSSEARIAVIDGMPGVGKTTLASRWAFDAAAHFPDGVLFAELNGYGTAEPAAPQQVLSHFLNQLEIEPPDPTYEGMISAYRSAVASRKILVVLDNARDAEQVVPLLPGPGQCATLITSRDRLDSLFIHQGTGNVHLGRLAREESLTLLKSTGGLAQTQQSDPCLDEIAELCGDLPLALIIAGGMIRHHIIGDLWDTCHTLRNDANRVSSLRLQGPVGVSVESAFQVSYRALSPEGRQLLWQLAVHPGPTIGRAAVRALTGWPTDHSRHPALEELHAANFVERTGDDRFSLHDLTRNFAERQAMEQRQDDRRRVAVRACEFLIHNAWACDQVLVPGRVLPIGAVSEYSVVAPSGIAEAMAWFTSEYRTLVKAVERSADLSMDRETWLLAMVMVTYQWRAYRYADAVQTLSRAAAAAESVASPTEQAMVHRMLGGTYRGLGQGPKAEWHAANAVRVTEASGDSQGIALSENALAILYCENGRLADAARHFGRAAKMLHEMGDQLNEAVALNGLGCISLNRGEYETALAYCDAAVRMFAPTTDTNGYADALANRGRIRLAKGERDHAISDLSSALASYQRLRYPRNEVRTRLDLADALVEARQTGIARDMLLRAQSLLLELQEPTDDVAERIRRLT